MAKPIEPTPELTGEDARRFLEEMVRRENSPPTKQEIELAKELQKLSKDLNLNRLFYRGASHS